MRRAWILASRAAPLLLVSLSDSCGSKCDGSPLASEKLSVAPAASSSTSYEWSRASSFSASELDAGITSCFTAVILSPRACAGSGLVPSRASRGYAFRIGNAAAMASDASMSHWRNIRAVAPRVLLVAHSRGGLELPGGKRDALESPEQTASRELLEEAGVVLSPPLAASEGVLVRVAQDVALGRYPRWMIFVRVMNDAAAFDEAVAAAAVSAKGYPAETFGNVSGPLWLEKKGLNGGARILAAMPSWQAEMLLSALVASGVLEVGEVRELAEAADALISLRGGRFHAGQSSLSKCLTDFEKDAPGG